MTLLACGTVLLGVTSFIEATQKNIPSHTKTTAKVSKKYKIGTRTTLLVL